MKIWPAKPPKLAQVTTATTMPQDAKGTTTAAMRKGTVMTDTISRDIVPAIMAVVVLLAERRRLEDNYVDRKWPQLEKGSPITDYSAGPDSPTREVTPRKIHQIADELAVIRDDRERIVEVPRNWNPAEPTTGTQRNLHLHRHRHQPQHQQAPHTHRHSRKT